MKRPPNKDRKSFLFRFDDEEKERINEWMNHQKNINASLSIIVNAFIDRFGVETDIDTHEVRKKITLDNERILKSELPELSTSASSDLMQMLNAALNNQTGTTVHEEKPKPQQQDQDDPNDTSDSLKYGDDLKNLF
ncbi:MULTISPECIES: hypothetical protein [Bacillus]|uniref:hypothetical protein n=1 Tax=Bacillus TaxID=1386 RepID=UPI00397E10B7